MSHKVKQVELSAKCRRDKIAENFLSKDLTVIRTHEGTCCCDTTREHVSASLSCVCLCNIPRLHFLATGPLMYEQQNDFVAATCDMSLRHDPSCQGTLTSKVPLSLMFVSYVCALCSVSYVSLMHSFGRCSENCAYKLTTSKEFVLTGEGCHDNNNKSCKWELYGPPPSKGGVSKRSVEESQLINVSYSKKLQLDPSNLIPNRTYTIFFNNEDSGFSAQYSVITDMSPTGGSCVVSPSEGIMIETQFRINCLGWTDEDSPLWYEFFFRHHVHGPMLLFYGWMPDSVGLFLPPGSKENNFRVDLFVKISDVLGSYRIIPLQVKVRGCIVFIVVCLF